MGGHDALRWGLIGASDIAETRMIPAIDRVGDGILAVASGAPEHGNAFAHRNGIPRYCQGLDELLEDPLIDAVYISSKNDRHAEQTIAAAAAGKHVLCEKPLATSLSDARSMIAACQAAGVVLAVNHHLPAAGTHQTIRRLLQSGSIGRPLSVSVRHSTLLPERLRKWRLAGEPGAGVVMDLSCHNASVVNQLLTTKPLHVMATTAHQGDWKAQAEDAASASIQYEDEVLVDFQDSFTLPYSASYIEVSGDKGTVTGYDVMTPEPTGTVVMTNGSGRREIPVADRRHTYDITLAAFKSSIHGGSRPIVDGVDAMNTLAISLAILRSASLGKKCAIDYTSASQ
ncbi:Gfo/Idh/MocA family protein [Arthrobacter sp. R4]|uniref:Gfo/Idh/MocA family protein n=1 Tax=Arthrobacter sp. R4 TaxID=644417 RepID=UPI003EDA2A69